MSSAYLLVSHGSRDPRPAIAMQELAQLLRNKLDNSYNQAAFTGGVSSDCKNQVGVAYLEASSEPLHEQIRQFAKSALAAGCNHLEIIPLFLLSGVHVMTDIPAEVALAQQVIDQDMMIDLRPYLGSHPSLGKLLTKSMAAINAQAWILLAHGSSRPGSQQSVEAIAASLGAMVAYWAVPPNLESRVKELVVAGYQEIGILPYFLFAGGITDAIARSIEELKLQFPMVNFQLAQPLGASAELAELIWDLVKK